MKMTIPIAPTGQARARATVRGGHARVYKGTKQRANEDAIIGLLAPHAPETPLAGPVELIVTAWMPIPASKTKRFRADAIAQIERPTNKPDLDNIVKNIKDCLTVLQFWGDDRQVVRIVAEKRYSAEPRWEIEIC